MTNEQLYSAIGIPILSNAAVTAILVLWINPKFDGIHKRSDDMRDLWRAKLHRVEEVLNARLKYIGQIR